jgi:predicted transcriptional regulator of viral defense system
MKTVMGIARKQGILRSSELAKRGIHRECLWALVESGQLEHIERGIYTPTDIKMTEDHGLVLAAGRVPSGVISLLSALRFHDLTTQLPSEVWITIKTNTWQPRLDSIQVRFVQTSGKAFSEGVDVHRLEGFPVRIYNPAKTVADCFKYRNKIGLDIAIEALRDCVRQKKATYAQLWHYANICRVSRIMKPYLEAIS